MVTPYYEYDDIRLFLSGIDEEDLVWHRDKENREIEVLEGNKWQLQFDDSLPFELCVGDVVTIDKLKYHRLIKGNDDLRIRIKYAN